MTKLKACYQISGNLWTTLKYHKIEAPRQLSTSFLRHLQSFSGVYKFRVTSFSLDPDARDFLWNQALVSHFGALKLLILDTVPVDLDVLPKFHRLRTLDLSVDVVDHSRNSPNRSERSGFIGHTLQDRILEFQPVHADMFNPALEIHFGSGTYHLSVGYPVNGASEMIRVGDYESSVIEGIPKQNVAGRSRIAPWSKALANKLKIAIQ
ncbi:hypothetical protein C8J56DRAFT_901819 [Mycena floridula]|nr:hypothetical protein C8J56DRAFT_901819 [Mycena floridula]